MLKKGFFTLFIIISFASFGNEVSNFINLGFSENSKYFMFAEYGQKSEDNIIYANSYIVDVKKNNFVKNGINTVSYNYLPNAEGDSFGVLFSLFSEKSNIFNQYKIQNYNTGRVVYSQYDSQLAQKIFNYRDFVTNKNYDIELNQITFGEKDSVESSFFIDVKVSDENNNIKSFMVGNPDVKRKSVEHYFIRQIVVAPDNNSFVFVVGKKIVKKGNIDIRYMVETVKF